VVMLGGIVICGRTDWILLLTKTSLTREAMRLDLPVPSSPQTQMRTIFAGSCQSNSQDERRERLNGK
jgi:hypothetical protein